MGWKRCFSQVAQQLWEGREAGIISAALPFRVKSEAERKSVNLNPLLKGNN